MWQARQGTRNSRVLDCMRHDWQSATAPDSVTSTVHNPRTLAATSDPDTHGPGNGGHPSWGPSGSLSELCAQLTSLSRRLAIRALVTQVTVIQMAL